MADQTALKRMAAQGALKYIEEGSVVGVGTGSTVNFFIEALKTLPFDIQGAVASSQATAHLLKSHRIPVLDPNACGDIPVYVDGADEVNAHGYMNKGGGGALTGEKIVANLARRFICIVDASKWVDVLGTFPIPVEVLPMARSLVGRKILAMGGDPALREGFITDYGNVIIDIYNLKALDPIQMETALNQIPGVVSNGIFAQRRADVVLVGMEEGLKTRVIT